MIFSGATKLAAQVLPRRGLISAPMGYANSKPQKAAATLLREQHRPGGP
jgi:hypothetical protein